MRLIVSRCSHTARYAEALGSVNCEAIVTHKGFPDEKDTPTLTAAINAPFHSPFASVALAHSLSSDVRVGVPRRCVELMITSLSCLGAERYRWVHSMHKDEGDNKLVAHRLTRNPFSEGSAHIGRLIKSIYHVKKRFGCVLHATRRIESVT